LVSGAEIDVDAFDLVAPKAEELGIAETLSTPGHALVGDKDLIAVGHDLFELMPFDPVAATPAAFE
jgi:hypothetical protein